MIYVCKTVNNGYGEFGGATFVRDLTMEQIRTIWSLRSTNDLAEAQRLDDLMDETGFNWNVMGDAEEHALVQALDKDGFVHREYEDYLLGVCQNDKELDMLRSMIETI